MSRAEWWSWWSGWLAVGFTVLAALTGLVSWYWSNRSADEHAERTRVMELTIAEQQERAAKAEAELLAMKDRLAPRHLDSNERATLVDVLKRGSGAIHIQYLQTDNGEPRTFAHQLGIH